jgi:hypothetical protein
MVYTAWIFSSIGKWHPDQSSLFQQGDYKNKGQNPEETVWGSSLSEDICNLKTKQDRRMVPRPK